MIIGESKTDSLVPQDSEIFLDQEEDEKSKESKKEDVKEKIK